MHERFESGFRDLTLCVKVLRSNLSKHNNKQRKVGPDHGLFERMVCARFCWPESLANYHSLIVEAHGVSAALLPAGFFLQEMHYNPSI